MTTEIAANVERGAEFLDAHHPGWDEQINLRTLDVSSTCGCVLGQLYKKKRGDNGAYHRGLDALGLTDGQATRLGFNVWGRQRFSRLTDSWKALIRQRRKARRA
jgi:hypothetical protein